MTVDPAAAIGDRYTLSPAEAAQQLGLTPERIRQLCSCGQLHHIRTSLGRLIDPTDVARLVQERAARSAA